MVLFKQEKLVKDLTLETFQKIFVCSFRWNDKVHGNAAEPFWIWVEDPESNHIYHSEYFVIHKKHVSKVMR